MLRSTWLALGASAVSSDVLCTPNLSSFSVNAMKKRPSVVLVAFLIITFNFSISAFFKAGCNTWSCWLLILESSALFLVIWDPFVD